MGLRGPRTWGKRVVDEEGADRMLNAVLDAGINFIDTAPDYGVAEERIGKYISHRRKEFFIATKCGCKPRQHDDHLEVLHHWEADTISSNIESSLRRLNTDYIDLLQFHGGTVNELEEKGLIQRLLDYQSQGVVRWIGISTSLPEINHVVDHDYFDVVQLPYSCLNLQHMKIMQRLAEHDVGIIVRGGIAQGGPDAEIQREIINQIWAAANLDELVPSGMSRAEFILRTTLSNSDCHTVIVGTSNLEHLRKNVAAATSGPISQGIVQNVHSRVLKLSL